MLLGTQRVNGNGALEIGGCDAVKLARRFGTPLYVLDEDCMRHTCREYRHAFESRYPKVLIAFAGKAFLTAAICRIAEQVGLGLDVSSAGELHTAVEGRIPHRPHHRARQQQVPARVGDERAAPGRAGGD